MQIKTIGLTLLLCLLAAANVPPTKVDHKDLSKLRWQQACAASTFRDMPLLDMIELAHQLSFHHIELSPGQPVSEQRKEAKVSHDMAPDDADAILAKLKAVKLDVVSYGPIEVGGMDEVALRKPFEFAKKFKAKNLVINEPPVDSLEMLQKLADEYSVNVAILSDNSLDSILRALEGKSKRLGICADLAAWKRAGLTPADCVARIGGRMIEVHLDDINALNQEVPFGQGTVDAARVLQQLKDEKFQGVFAIKYSTGTGQELLENFAKSINGFNEIVEKVAGTPDPTGATQ